MLKERVVSGVNDQETSLADVIRLLWRRRRLVLVLTILSTACGAIYAFTARPMFRADVVVMLAGKSRIGSGLSQLGGLASLAGINLDSSDGSQTPLAVLRSQSLARDFILRKGLVVDLTERKGLYAWLRSWRVSRTEAADIRDAVRSFDDRVRRVTDDKKSGLVTLSIVWVDGETAAIWANELISSVNNRLRAQSESEAEKNIGYLEKEIAGTSVPALQQSLSKMLESEMQKLLLAKGNDEFAFKIIDPATPPKERSFPNRTLVLAGSLILGLILSISLVIISESGFMRQLSNSGD
jgi:uncharacterized protein involved in exopolysaccharide biosynthesis